MEGFENTEQHLLQEISVDSISNYSPKLKHKETNQFSSSILTSSSLDRQELPVSTEQIINGGNVFCQFSVESFAVISKNVLKL